MLIAELEKRNDAAWRAYCRVRDAADHSLQGSPALIEFGRVHALIIDHEHPELFEAWAKEAEATDKTKPTAAAGPKGVGPAGATGVGWANEEAEDEEDDARAASAAGAASHKPPAHGKR